MEVKQIKDLMAAMGRTGTKKLTIKKNDFELQLEREDNAEMRLSDQFNDLDENPMRGDIELHRAQAFLRGTVASSVAAQETKDFEDSKGVFITSPMVGTFFGAPSPDDPAYIKIGDQVEKSTVVCIVEAMKVMNEVKAGVSGTVAEILVENGQPIEFGTKLFRIQS